MKIYWLILGLLIGLMPSMAFASSPVDGRAGRAEVRFMTGLMDHYQIGINMANDCLAKATTASVRGMCQIIIAAQTIEIEQMQNWLADWYNIDYSPRFAHAMNYSDVQMDNMPSADPATTIGVMAGFNHLGGLEYEIAWLEAVLDHYDDTIHRAERILEQIPDGEGHVDLHIFAERIVEEQSTGIIILEDLLTEIVLLW